MTQSAAYRGLPEPTRESIRAAAQEHAAQAAQRYADLQAAEAGIAARAVYPDVARLVFGLSDEIDGACATLLAAYDAAGRVLRHVDTDDEWPDESLVTDHLAAAADWSPDYFPAAADTDDAYEPHLGGDQR